MIRMCPEDDYIRNIRKGARETNALIGGTIDMFSNYLGDKDWRIKENSNMQKSINGLNNYVREAFTKMYWLNEVYPENIAQAYVDGHMHIHDLGGLSLYCCGYSLKDVLLKGVRGVPNIPVSVPAKHFDSALSQLANLVTVFQNEILG